MELEANAEDNPVAKSYWRFRREDFFPEKSFRSWAAYRSAVRETHLRLADRFLARSSSTNELGALRRRSGNDMRRSLSWWDLTCFSFGSVIGAGIFVLTGQESRFHAGPAIVLSYAASGVSALLSVFCVAELATEIPAAGASFAYLRVELGDLAAFLGAANVLLESVVGRAAVARAWTSYLATLMNRRPDSFRVRASGLAREFSLLDPVAAAVILATSASAALSMKKTSYLNSAVTVTHLMIIVFVIVAGFAHADAGNLSPFLPYGAKGIFQAAAVVYFAYGGFDSVATMAEETRNPSRDIPLGLLGSMTAITVIYCLMALSLSTMQRYTDIDPNAAYSVAFHKVGMQWAQYIIALGALEGMTTALLVGSIGTARYTTHIARSHVIPPFFALVHPKTATPIFATVLMAIFSACLALFSSLNVLASLLSISTLFIFAMMATALLVRRYYVSGVSSKRDLRRLVLCLLLIIGASIATSAYWGLRPDGWVGYLITAPIWTVGNLMLIKFVPRCREPKVWGVPLVPWLPSLSIATNLFLMGSLGREAFIRFGVCSGIMLVYYVLVGVHATYDAAHECEEEINEMKNESLENGSGAQ